MASLCAVCVMLIFAVMSHLLSGHHRLRVYELLMHAHDSIHHSLTLALENNRIDPNICSYLLTVAQNYHIVK